LLHTNINDPSLMTNSDIVAGYLQGLCAAYVVNYMREIPHIIKTIAFYSSENHSYS